jgi:hypothetical protein
LEKTGTAFAPPPDAVERKVLTEESVMNDRAPAPTALADGRPSKVVD